MIQHLQTTSKTIITKTKLFMYVCIYLKVLLKFEKKTSLVLSSYSHIGSCKFKSAYYYLPNRTWRIHVLYVGKFELWGTLICKQLVFASKKYFINKYRLYANEYLRNTFTGMKRLKISFELWYKSSNQSIYMHH